MEANRIAKLFGGLYVVRIILSLLSKRGKARILLDKDILQSTAAITGVSALFSLLDSQQASENESRSSLKWRSFLNGCFASSLLVFEPNASRRYFITLTVVLRTLYYASRALVYDVESGRTSDDSSNQQLAVRQFPNSPIRNQVVQFIDKVGVYVVWALNAYYICYWSVLDEDAVSPSYRKSLMYITCNKERYGPENDKVMRGFMRLTTFLSNQPSSHPWAKISDPSSKQFMSSLCSNQLVLQQFEDLHQKEHFQQGLNDLSNIVAVIPGHLKHDYTGCALIHPQHQSCEENAFFVLRLCLPRIIRAYSMINGVVSSFQLVKWLYSLASAKNNAHDGPKENKLKGLYKILTKFVASTIQSIVAISGYMVAHVYGICLWRRVFGREVLASYGLAGVTASPFIWFIDKPSRLPELNIYCTSQVLDSLWRLGVRNGHFRYIDCAEMLLLVPAAGYLTMMLKWQPKAVNGVYGSLFRRFFNIKA